MSLGGRRDATMPLAQMAIAHSTFDKCILTLVMSHVVVGDESIDER
jgi:hypothetical protein